MHIHELFLKTARRLPEVEALSFGAHTLSYGDCAARVEALARGLAGLLPPGSRVAINTYKSADTILMMLACLQAGLAYVPIDPTMPMARRCFILHDSAACALMIDERTAREWEPERAALAELALVIGSAGAAAVQSLSVDDLAARGLAVADTARTAPGDDDLAYILYTSGSTGAPKGVMISHRNSAAFVEWALGYFDVRPGDRVAVHAPLHFDLPVFDLYVSLARGATVCPIDERTVLFPEALLRFLREQRITVLYAVPSALTALINRSTLASSDLPNLRLLLYAGEEFHPAPLGKLMRALPNASVFNLYGPIETNVVTAFDVCSEHLDYQRIPIGQPIANTRIVLLDGAGQLVDGCQQEGEIAVIGASVSPGYLNRPDLTAERFVPNPFGEGLGVGGWGLGAGRHGDTETRRHGDTENGDETSTQSSVLSPQSSARLYRTGDFAEWDAQGVLHFLGRRDALIKTRGFRVDLGDVEATLATHPDIAEAAVTAVPHPDYTHLLYAFVVPAHGRSVEERDLVAWCRNTLPAYMVPHKVMLRDQLPKTSTGKIARRQLIVEQPGAAGT